MHCVAGTQQLLAHPATMRDVSLQRYLVPPILLLLNLLTCAAASAEQLLLVGEPASDAVWQSITDEGAHEFRVGETNRQVPQETLVRWSTPSTNVTRDEAILVDGTRLVLADSWGGTSSLQLVDDRVTLTTNRLGTVELSPKQLRAALLSASTDALRRTNLLDRLLGDSPATDRVYLTNGDALSGRVSRISAPSSSDEAVVLFSLSSETEPVELPVKRIAGIRWGKDKPDVADGELIVGLRDGSRLVTRVLKSRGDRFSAELACGLVCDGRLQDVVHLRTLGSQVTYVSDVKEIDYQHEPYLDIAWPYRRDRNVLSGPLVVDGLTYDKGIGMVTAARLTYRVPPDCRRFAAAVAIDAVAIDEEAARRGSVVFRVYLLRSDDWQLAFASPVVRGGDSPLSVSVELANAKEIALVTDYAERGDELDYANWLDARFE
jgi:hypothetical protein